jgi:hypothetical protein
MSNDKQQTLVEWIEYQIQHQGITHYFSLREILNQAKEMEKNHKGYTKADVIKAGEMGEINYLDTLHITTYLDEAKKFNETYGGNK